MTVLVLTIWSPGAEVTTSLHATQAGAFQTLVEWVENIWTAGAVGCDRNSFDTTSKMVEHFFKAMSEDCQYDMSYKRVHGLKAGEQPELAPDEILFYPKEVEATIYALEHTRFAEMAHSLGSGPATCHRVALEIIKKLKA